MQLKKIEREKQTVSRMIQLYSLHKLKTESLPEELKELELYAHNKLNKCKFQEKKPQCKKCPIHCYKPDMRNKIREIMRWTGPRMIIYSPINAIKHLLNL